MTSSRTATRIATCFAVLNPIVAGYMSWPYLFGDDQSLPDALVRIGIYLGFPATAPLALAAAQASRFVDSSLVESAIWVLVAATGLAIYVYAAWVLVVRINTARLKEHRSWSDEFDWDSE